MGKDEEKDTNLDPKWSDADLTGGNDSGSSDLPPEEVSDPVAWDRTGRILQEEGQERGVDPSMMPPIRNAVPSATSRRRRRG